MIGAFESTVRQFPQRTCFTYVDEAGAELSFSYSRNAECCLRPSRATCSPWSESGRLPCRRSAELPCVRVPYAGRCVRRLHTDSAQQPFDERREDESRHGGGAHVRCAHRRTYRRGQREACTRSGVGASCRRRIDRVACVARCRSTESTDVLHACCGCFGRGSPRANGPWEGAGHGQGLPPVDATPLLAKMLLRASSTLPSMPRTCSIPACEPVIMFTSGTTGPRKSSTSHLG